MRILLVTDSEWKSVCVCVCFENVARINGNNYKEEKTESEITNILARHHKGTNS